MKTFLRAAALATLFAASTLFILFAAHAPRASAQDANQSARQRITVASGARVRERPDTGAGELARLQLGVVVDELERSPEKSKVGAAEDYWYQVSAPGGVKGWVFGSLTAPFDSSRREEIYRRIADERLASSAATFAELADLVRFLDRATKEVTQRDALAELEFARLQALARSLSVIPFEQHETSPYKDWTTERADEIVYNEPSDNGTCARSFSGTCKRSTATCPSASASGGWPRRRRCPASARATSPARSSTSRRPTAST